MFQDIAMFQSESLSVSDGGCNTLFVQVSSHPDASVHGRFVLKQMQTLDLHPDLQLHFSKVRTASGAAGSVIIVGTRCLSLSSTHPLLIGEMSKY